MSEQDIERGNEETTPTQANLTRISSFLFPPSRSSSTLADEDEYDNDKAVTVPLLRRISNESLSSYHTMGTESSPRIIRFQVVVWYVGRPDEVLGKVEMKFRVTIFWNPTIDERDEELGFGLNNPHNKKVWKMHGRQRAYRTELGNAGGNDQVVFVPPVSILNAADLEIIEEPEVCQVNTEENMMRWSCLYKAALLQDNMKVAEFPHDSHHLVIRLGIIKQRQRRKRWDKQKWTLGLATRHDTQEMIQYPHGLILDHVRVPGFSYDKDGLDFQFRPLDFGILAKDSSLNRDQCLEVGLYVMRDSSYYDRNIIPLLVALNGVGISILAMKPSEFGARGACVLAIAFVEMGIRTTVDKKLPVVGYQIKLQWVLNHYFFGLLALVAESSLAYLLHGHGYHMHAIHLDFLVAIFEFLHMMVVLFIYFIGSGNVLDKLCLGFFRNRMRYGQGELF